ncbi:MAG TPA: fumarylacetoacetate hydrolase family protein [Dehalococcoidia bacterium]|nr:fumarylacetoacetate hydrolase family protein [Dehalococcoidia bacterium]
MNSATVAPYAEEMMRLADTASLGKPLSARVDGFGIADAYKISREVLRRREAAGWRRVGRKIGFTNRTILEQYGVFDPIFGYMYDRTVSYASDGAKASLSLAGLVQPLIEPEIVFRLRRPPPDTGDPRELLDCIEWLSHGFEIVQCHFPRWKFKAADTVADGGLHGRYVVGPPVAVDPASFDTLAQQLAAFRIASFKNGWPAAEGGGEFVLGSPLNALAHLFEVLRGLPDHPPLEGGEIVTTGTLTAALPVVAGETWSTRIDGLAVAGMELRLV